jgi:hypothetical protein
VNTAEGVQNWFSMIVAGLATAPSVTACNSQAFWLPMPVDGRLTVSFNNGVLSPGGCIGEVEIHGYYPCEAAK